MTRAFSTSTVPPSRRFEFWRELITRQFVPLRPERKGTAIVWGEVVSAQVGPFEAAFVRSSHQSIHRSAAEIARSSDEVFFLNVQLSGTSGLRQGVRDVVLKPGDWALVDTSRPFVLDVDDPMEHLTVRLPRDVLTGRSSRIVDRVGTRVAGRYGVGRLVVGYLRALAAGPLDEASSVLAGEHVLDLVVATLNGQAADPGCTYDAAKEGQYARALQYLRTHCDRPNLSPRHVAEHLGVSLRYVQTLFATRGDTVGRRLLATRLARCRADLVAGAHRHRSITEIAFSHGFNDPSHFSRAFRAAFGTSARAWRRTRRPS